MLPRCSPLLVVLIALTSSTTALTEFDPSDPSSCQIIGDPDIYGIGIRVSYYLQWASLMFAILLAPETTKNIRISTNIVSFALYINVFRSVKSNSLIALEFYLVSWMTIILLLANLPWNATLIRSSFASTTIMLVLWTIFMWTQVYMYSNGLHIGQRADCIIWTWGNGTHFSAYHNMYQNTALEIIGAVGLGIASIVYVIMAIGFMCAFGSNKSKHSARHSNDWSTAFRFILLIVNAILGSVSIVTVEKTIRRNHIDLSAAPLLQSSGQLIALVMGILSLITVIWAHFDAPEEPEEETHKPSAPASSGAVPQSHNDANSMENGQIPLHDMQSAEPSEQPAPPTLGHASTM